MAFIPVLVATIVVCVLLDLVVLKPLTTNAQSLAQGATKALSTIRSARISDHWKEKVMLAYAWRIFRSSIGLLAWLLPVLAVYGLVYLLIATFTGSADPLGVVNPSGGELLVMVLVGIVYLIPRRYFGR